MCIARSLVGLGRPVTTQHRRRSPAHNPHQVGLSPALCEPPVGRGVPELLGVQPVDADQVPAAANHQFDAVVGEDAAATVATGSPSVMPA